VREGFFSIMLMVCVLEERGHATAGSWCGAKNRREKGEGVLSTINAD
jgi:hypothetical protein